MTTTEISNLFFNCQFVSDVCVEGAIDNTLLNEAAQKFLAMLPSLEGEITMEWLMNDFLGRL